MKLLSLTSFLILGNTCYGLEFEAPVQVIAGNNALKVEAPGFGAPCFADINGDGKKELLVGQFNSGKIKIYQHKSGNKFAVGEWLKANDKVVEVPGVW